jgi:flagellar hook-length control protein FliK
VSATGATGGASAATGASPVPATPAGTGATSSTGATQNAALPQATVPTRVVELQNAVDAVRATFTMAVRQGVSQARISLSPESLGGLKISLSQTSEGLIARVVAEHPAALQTLQQSSSELRQSLEASGVNLLRLDIEAQGQSGATPDQAGQAATGGSSARSAEADEPMGEEQTATAVLSLSPSDGSLVNVLA